jgi:hypothetical protein
LRTTSKLSEGAGLHLGAKPCGQFGVPQELPKYLVPASATFHDLVEDHLEPAPDDL